MGETAVDLAGHIEASPLSADTKVSQFSRLFHVPTEIPDFKELIKQSSQKVRPWMEFINTGNFKTPPSIPRTAKRIKKNLEYFYGNYIFVSLGLVIYCLVTSPLLLLALAGSFYINRYVNRCYESKNLKLFGQEISKNQRFLVVALLSMPLLYLVGVHSAIFWVLGASFMVIMLHAAFYNIEAVNPSPETEALFGEEIEKLPKWARRHGKAILLHDNAPADKAEPVQDTIKTLGWELLPHLPYSLDLTPSNYHLFSLMGHALTEQHFHGGGRKLGVWLVCLKRRRNLLAWYPQIARKAVKMCRKQRPIL